MLAYDWFYLAPTHPLEIPDSANLVELLVYLGVGVLVGEVATRAARRGEVAEVARVELADEHAALRRVATLVAEVVPADELLAAVAAEAGTLLDVDSTRIDRFDAGDEIVTVAEWCKPGTSVAGEPQAGAPVVVDGRRWGVLLAWSRSGALPSETASRLMEFTQLVATAIANAEARRRLERLAEEQAALRRVATLVARQASPPEVFAAVAQEVGLLLGADGAWMECDDSDGSTRVVASWGVTEPGHGTTLRCPIVVDGRPWGTITAATLRPEPLPADTGSRIEQFTELVATAISNVEARSALAASRARVVAATDQTRRRFERDLHDGVQQRIVSLGLELQSAVTRAASQDEELAMRLGRVGEGLTGALDDLRELSRGIHPAILSEGGLGPALKALARRSALPVELDLNGVGRLAERVEITAYYVVSEALANTAKHAQASTSQVEVEARDGVLALAICDDGVGGAAPVRGSGLIGLTDRVEALGGTIAIDSLAGAGTSVRVELPLE
jgi:signal transduction histidine kinase